MSTISQDPLKLGKAEPDPLPPLEPGDHLDRETFHARYEAMPPHVRAELIGGIVYMPSALQRRHGLSHPLLTRWLDEYAEATPGTELYDSASAFLSDDSEPQPDLSLLIDPAKGGQ